MKKMNRNEAIDLLCRLELSSLSVDDRESYILDWWSMDEDDAEYDQLSKSLQNKIIESDDVPDDITNKEYDELIFLALLANYKGVTNRFLSQCLATMNHKDYEVFGDVELLEVCPCCNYRTLASRGEYDICPQCNWEDNGIDEANLYSGPNHMTLAEGQKKFVDEIGQQALVKYQKGQV